MTVYQGTAGSLGAQIVGSVTLGGPPIVVDTRASTVPTQWILQTGGSGAVALINAPSGGITGAIKLASWVMGVGASPMRFQSPSGTDITRSILLQPTSGGALHGVLRNPTFICAANATLNVWFGASTNAGDWAVGWID